MLGSLRSGPANSYNPVMATLREYFDADFAYAARVHVKLQPEIQGTDCVLLYDFSAYTVFIACYVAGEGVTAPFFLRLLESLRFGASQVTVAFNSKVTLPSARTFPGLLEARNTNPLELRAQFFGDTEWISTNEIPASTRIFLYAEASLTEADVLEIKQRGRELGQRVQVRSKSHAETRSKVETPLAFISHDWRDKTEVARPIAINLQKRMCPVWYDEFSLKVGANLRESIEKGLKTCRKCILILSPSFFSNRGWTKKEFDSIFVRGVIEGQEVVLPVWHEVTKRAVYDYSPSLVNIKGLDWDQLGEDETCRQLAQAILDQ